MDQEDIVSLIRSGKFTNPHDFLGFQKSESLIRIWHPERASCKLKIRSDVVEAKPHTTPGLFVVEVPEPLEPDEYWIAREEGKWAHDPYAFEQTLGDLDVHLLAKGLHYELYDRLGATAKIHQGVEGISFAVWAPNALSVLLKGSFNGFDGKKNPMRSVGSTGIWELFVPGIKSGELYYFEVISKEGDHFVKVDPVAHHGQMRPKNASIVFDVGKYTWNDDEWMAKRGCYRSEKAPLNLYEVHLGSWKQKEGTFYNYRELAPMLAAYCKQMHYTHVELMGICEHPLDESWGYQVTGYFAPTSRHGTPEDFQYFVDFLHQNGIGVILDWVPGHFPTDPHSLCQFDGTYLYEHMDPRKGYHPHWNTHIFNYGRWEVSNFLIASALFWLEKMHIDGLRVDAVASMLYLDYGREPGQWLPNSMGSNINLEAVEFLKHLNSIVRKRVPDVLTIAEESTFFPSMTKPVDQGGLGFDYKWNLGWMNDTLHFFSAPFSERKGALSVLTHALEYAFSEKFVLVLSHDEVVHEKRSLLSKMPGSGWLQFGGLRNLLGYLITFPGKKLLFMGGEWGQTTEWDCKSELPWGQFANDPHQKVQKMVAALNRFYLDNEALFAFDHSGWSFEWVVSEDKEHLVIAFLRKAKGQKLLCVHHFGSDPIEEYPIALEGASLLFEVFNTDSMQWGGSGKMNGEIRVENGTAVVCLGPVSSHIFELKIDDHDKH